MLACIDSFTEVSITEDTIGGGRIFHTDVEECYICHDNYANTGGAGKLLDCGHHACKGCIMNELINCRIFCCGYCRFPITAPCGQPPTKRFKIRSLFSKLTGIRNTGGLGLARLLGLSDSHKANISPQKIVENFVDSLRDFHPTTSETSMAQRNKPFKFRTYLSQITGIRGTYGFGICYILGLSKMKPFYYKQGALRPRSDILRS